MKVGTFLRLAGILGCFVSTTAGASLIFDSTIVLSAQGFGNAPRDLTIQGTGNDNNNPTDFESGCVGVGNGGAIIIGPTGCPSTDATILGNGVIPVGGDEPNPHADNQKYGDPTLGSLGILTASDIGILFNAAEPGGDSIDLIDITMGIYSSTGTLLASIDGEQSFASTDPGVGSAGFVFKVDATQQALLNAAIFTPRSFSGYYLGAAGKPHRRGWWPGHVSNRQPGSAGMHRRLRTTASSRTLDPGPARDRPARAESPRKETPDRIVDPYPVDKTPASPAFFIDGRCQLVSPGDGPRYPLSVGNGSCPTA